MSVAPMRKVSMRDAYPGFEHVFALPDGVPSRVLLLLHGTGGDEQQMVSLGRQLDLTAALLSVRGKVREGTANRFFRRLAEGVFDMPDLITRTAELAAFVRAAVRHYAAEPLPIVAAGYSNGANMALSLMLREPGLLAGGALFRAMPQETPDPRPDLAGVAVLLAAGELDPLVPPESLEELQAILKRSGATVSTAIQRAGHDLTREDLVAAASWLGDLPNVGVS